MMDLDLFRMPSSSRVLLLSAIVSLASALPRSGPDATASYNAADWNPRPTNAPQASLELLRRDGSDTNICGWFNGDFNQPSACPSDQKCVYDTNHGMVGCCPQSGACTTGVYATCVVGQQGAIDPSVLTCSGQSVCYQNTYPGGYYQYGCGASTDGQYIATTYSGQAWSSPLPIVYTQLTLATTQSSTSTTSSSSVLTQSSSSSTSTSTSTSTSSSSSSFSSAQSSIASSSTFVTTRSTSSQTSSSTTDPAAAQSATKTSTATPVATASGSREQVGIIAGSVVGGVAVIFAILAAACVLVRRRRNRRAEERARSVPEKEKTMSISSYASSHISSHTRIHPFSPDDIVSPLTPPQQPAVALVQQMAIIESQQEKPQMNETQGSHINNVPSEDTPEIQPPVENEWPLVRRVQLADGPSIDDIADLPPPWVRPPTPPPRSPKRLTMIVHPPEDHTPLEIYLKSQITPIHHSVSVSSNTSDSSRYSRTTDGRSVKESICSGNWQQEDAPPMPIMRKPVGSGWYRTMPPLVEKRADEHVAYQLAGESEMGRSLTAPQQTRGRSFSMPSQASVTENVLSKDTVMSATVYEIQELDGTGMDRDWVAPLRLSASKAPSVMKRGRTPVPLLGVPAAPPPGGRGSRLYEV